MTFVSSRSLRESITYSPKNVSSKVNIGKKPVRRFVPRYSIDFALYCNTPVYRYIATAHVPDYTQ